MATRKISNVEFEGLSQDEMVAFVVDSANEATTEAVAETHQLGLDSPGSRKGRLVALTPQGKFKTLES